VRPATLEKVEEAIKALGYRPSASARSLAGNRSFLLGLLYDNPSASYVMNVQNGVLKSCLNQRYDLLIHPCSFENPGLKEEITELIRHSRVDGLILTPPLTDSDALLELLEGLNVPRVLISPVSNRKFRWGVGTNDRVACCEMVRYLAGLGHTRIAFIKGHPDHRAIGNRYEGYLEGLRENGLKQIKSLVVQGYNSFESGEACARKLLSGVSRPTAIFASNDDMAAGALKAAHELGLSIPGDVSVAGFDDIPLASQVWPPLTTIRQPIQQMGEAAASMLIDRARGKESTGSGLVIESELVLRKSTGPAPAS
jgi:LacI family transcriptional regulator